MIHGVLTHDLGSCSLGMFLGDLLGGGLMVVLVGTLVTNWFITFLLILRFLGGDFLYIK